jgi:hypothetical protein
VWAWIKLDGPKDWVKAENYQLSSGFVNLKIRSTSGRNLGLCRKNTARLAMWIRNNDDQPSDFSRVYIYIHMYIVCIYIYMYIMSIIYMCVCVFSDNLMQLDLWLWKSGTQNLMLKKSPVFLFGETPMMNSTDEFYSVQR